MPNPQRWTNGNRRSQFRQRNRPALAQRARFDNRDSHYQISRSAESYLPFGIQKFLLQQFSNRQSPTTGDAGEPTPKIPKNSETRGLTSLPGQCPTSKTKEKCSIPQKVSSPKFNKKAETDIYGCDSWASKVVNDWNQTMSLSDKSDGSSVDLKSENVSGDAVTLTAAKGKNAFFASEAPCDKNSEGYKTSCTKTGGCGDSGNAIGCQGFSISDVCEDLAKKFGTMWAAKSDGCGENTDDSTTQKVNDCCEGPATNNFDETFEFCVEQFTVSEKTETLIETSVNEYSNSAEAFVDRYDNVNIDLLSFNEQSEIQFKRDCLENNTSAWAAFPLNSTDCFPSNQEITVSSIHAEHSSGGFTTDSCGIDLADFSSVDQNQICSTDEVKLNSTFDVFSTTSALKYLCDVPDGTYTNGQLVSEPYNSCLFNAELGNQSNQHCELHNDTANIDQQYKSETPKKQEAENFNVEFNKSPTFNANHAACNQEESRPNKVIQKDVLNALDLSKTLSSAGSDLLFDLENESLLSDLHENTAFSTSNNSSNISSAVSGLVDQKSGARVKEQTQKDKKSEKLELAEIFEAKFCNDLIDISQNIDALTEEEGKLGARIQNYLLDGYGCVSPQDVSKTFATIGSEQSFDLDDDLSSSGLHAANTTFTISHCSSEKNDDSLVDHEFAGDIQKTTLNVSENDDRSHSVIKLFEETNFLDDSLILDAEPDNFVVEIEMTESYENPSNDSESSLASGFENNFKNTEIAIQNAKVQSKSNSIEEKTEVSGEDKSAVSKICHIIRLEETEIKQATKRFADNCHYIVQEEALELIPDAKTPNLGFENNFQNTEIDIQNTKVESGSNCSKIEEQSGITSEDTSTVSKICHIIRLEETEIKQITKRFLNNCYYIVQDEVQELTDDDEIPNLGENQVFDTEFNQKFKETNFITLSESMRKQSHNIFEEFLIENKDENIVKDQAGDYSSKKAFLEVKCNALSFGSASGDHVTSKEKANEVANSSSSSSLPKRPGSPYPKRLMDIDAPRIMDKSPTGSDFDISLKPAEDNKPLEILRPSMLSSSFDNTSNSSSASTGGLEKTSKKTGRFSKLKNLFSRKK